MATQVQLRGGTTTEHDSFTGASREVTVDTTKKTIVVHDGSTAGGIPLAKESGSTFTNVDINSGTIDGVTIGGASAGAGTFTTLTTGSTVTLNGGTANGVLYLNGSKAATSGAALTFDGTNLSLGGAITAGRAQFTTSGTPASGAGIEITYGQEAASTGGILAYNRTAGTYQNIIYNAAAHIHSISGSEVMRLTSTGLGIGTTSPSALVEAGKSQNSVTDIKVTNANTGTAAQARLTLGNSGSNIGAVGFLGGSFTTSGVYRQDGAYVYSNGAGGLTLVTGAAQPIYFAINNSEKMRIDSSGRVGIGTTSPATTLHLQATTGATLRLSSSDTSVDSGSLGQLEFYSNDASAGGTGIKGRIEVIDNGSTGQNYEMNFFTGYVTGGAHAETKKMTIGPFGDISFYEDTGTTPKLFWDASAESLGIGTTSPNAKLDIVATTNTIRLGRSTSSYATIDSNSNAGSLNLNADAGNIAGGGSMTFNFAGAEKMRIDSAGNLLVGTTSLTAGINARLTAKADGSGNSAISANSPGTTAYNVISIENGNGQVGRIQTNGSTTSYLTSSDYRLKENITDANDAGDKIDAIKVRQYDWKADGSHQDYGMVAQELLTVAPEAVSSDPESDDMMGVDYSKLVPMLVKEIQALRQRVYALESK